MRQMRIIYHNEPEGWWAESPDIEKWSAAGDSYDEIRQLVVDGLRYFCGEDIEILEERIIMEHENSEVTISLQSEENFLRPSRQHILNNEETGTSSDTEFTNLISQENIFMDASYYKSYAYAL